MTICGLTAIFPSLAPPDSVDDASSPPPPAAAADKAARSFTSLSDRIGGSFLAIGGCTPQDATELEHLVQSK